MPPHNAFIRIVNILFERYMIYLFSLRCINANEDNEIEYEEIAYEKPEVIMEKIEGLEDQIKSNIFEVKGMLKQA